MKKHSKIYKQKKPNKQQKKPVQSSCGNNFLTALNKAFERNNSKSQEAYYLAKNFHRTIEHVSDIIKNNPNMTKQEVEESLILEFNNMSLFLQNAPALLANFYSYSAAKYLETHPNKYSELSQKLEESHNDFENSSSIKLISFDDYLLEYLYSIKKSMFDSMQHSVPETSNSKNQNIIKSFDSFLLDYFKTATPSSSTKSEENTKSQNSSLDINYNSTTFQEILNSVMVNFILSTSSAKRKELEADLKPRLSSMIAETVNTIDKVSDLNNYLASYVYQMYVMGFSEIAKPFLKENVDEEELKRSASKDSYNDAIQKFDDSTDVSQLKKTLSKPTLENSTLPLETLLALEAFWLNRLSKDLESYSEALFGVYNFNIVDKLIKGEDVKVVTDKDFQNLLIKMNTLYGPARIFLTNSKKLAFSNSVSFPRSAIPHARHSKSDLFDKSCKEIALENKLCLSNVSVNNFSNYLQSYYDDEYQTYFERMLPESSNNIKTDAAWYLKLIAPILSSYKLKDNLIKNLISCIQTNDKDSTFLNVGLLLDNFSDKDSKINLPETVGIGFDIGLSYPIRLHVPSFVLTEFINSSKDSIILPIFNGSKDFIDPQNSSSLLTSFVVYPYNDEQKQIIDERLKQEPASDSKSQNFINHLCYIDKDHVPNHFNNESGSIQKFVDLKTGQIYVKDQDGSFVPFVPEEISTTKKPALDERDEL